MKKTLLISSSILALTPIIAFAAAGQEIQDFITDTIGLSVQALITVLVSIATLVFIWGVISYIAAGGDETKMKTAKSYIVFSIIGLTLILGIWGIAAFLREGLGLDRDIPGVVLPGGTEIAP